MLPPSADSPRAQAQFLLTIDDLAEASFGSRRRMPLILASGGWLFLGTVLTLLFVGTYVVKGDAPAGGATARNAAAYSRPPTTNAAERVQLLLEVTSLGILLVLLPGSAMLWHTLKKPPAPWLSAEQRKRASPATVVWGIFLGMGAILALNVSRTAFEVAIILMPVTVLHMVLGIWPMLQMTIGLRRPWGAQTNLHVPVTLTADETGVRSLDERVKSHYAWCAFAGYRETEDLILLYLSPGNLLMVPKRGFATEADLIALRRLLHEHVTEGTRDLSAPGFQVIHGPQVETEENPAAVATPEVVSGKPSDPQAARFASAGDGSDHGVGGVERQGG